MKNTKRIIALFLAAVTLLSSLMLIGCNGDNGGETKGPDVTTDASATTEPITEPPVTEVLPDKTDVNYDGYEFNILIANRATKTINDFEDENIETVMGQAAFRRNAIMEESYGVTFNTTVDLGNNHKGNAIMTEQYNSKSTDYDMCIINTYTAAPLATSGYLFDLSKLPNVDLTKPWWDQTINEGINIKGSIYFTCGDISTSVFDFMYATIFNKNIYAEKVTDGTDVYKLVEEGKWTLDELARLVVLVGEDLDGNDIMDTNDLYGLLTWGDMMYASIQAGGERIAKINGDGLMELTLNNERVVNITEKYLKMANDKEHAINFQDTSRMPKSDWKTLFSENRALFFMSLLNEVSVFRDMESDYGILPIPKYDLEQEEWYTTFSAGLAAFVCVPFILEDEERTGAIIELLGYEAQDTITPAYYEKTLVGSRVRDDESTFCLDIIFGNKFVDVGHYFRPGTLNTSLWNYSMSGRTGAFSTMYDSYKKQAERDVETINKRIIELQENYD